MVGMRLRPFVGYETGQKQCITIKDNVVSTVGEVTGSASEDYAFDVAMDSSAPKGSPDFCGQEKCYNLMGKRMLEHVLQGFNTCLFCYGQTGTGKTTTIMGQAQPASEQGLLLRLITDIFLEVDKRKAMNQEVHVSVCMLEVYNEKLNDLLTEGADPKKKKQVDLHVHPQMGVHLSKGKEDKTPLEKIVFSAEDCVKWIDYGNAMKTVAATMMNAQSSRGHTVFILKMERKGGDGEDDALTTTSEVYFADLAGRENIKTTQVTGDRLHELTFINKSLMFLAECIRSLGSMASQKRKTVTATTAAAKPKMDLTKFRDTKLTLLLANALSGNSKTAMIGTLSPALQNFEESISTLKFAQTVKTIKLEAKKATAIDKETLVKKLEEEVRELKKALELARETHDRADIKEKIEATQAIAQAHARDWHEVEQLSAEQGKMRNAIMQRLGCRRLDEGDVSLPYLANYSEDPYLAFKLILHVPPDNEPHSVGSGESNDLRLPPGLGVSFLTCYVRNDNGRLWIRAAEVPYGVLGNKRPANVEVNFCRLGAAEVELKHLDTVLFGRSMTFYAFLEPTAAETLAAKVWNQPHWSQLTTEVDLETLLPTILGDERISDDLEVQLAKEYYSTLQSKHMDSEGAALLRAFVLSTRRARKKVEEANDITAEVKMNSGLTFELVCLAPVFSLGFQSSGHFPELAVRLVRRITKARQRWNKLVKSNFTRQKSNALLIADAVEQSQQIGTTDAGDSIQVLFTWTWSKFSSRLELMHAAYQAYLADRNTVLPHAIDPWAEHGPGEVSQLIDDQKREILAVVDEMRDREKELSESLDRERRANAEILRLKQELEAAREQLQIEIKSSQTMAAALSSMSPTGKTAAAVSTVGRAAAASFTDAVSRVSRCIDLSNANRMLLKGLVEVQTDGCTKP